jgi:TonB-linked SusC/RagA family outer membrane protein
MKVYLNCLRCVRVFLFVTCGLLLTFSYAAAQQGVTVKGKALDSDGTPLAGVAIILKGTNIGAASNDQGDYSLSNIPVGSILEYVLVGYATVEKKVDLSNAATLNVILVESSESLDEITVVAFGTQRKESVIGSITTVKPGELKIPSSNLTTAFSGRVAGLISYQQSGEPGQDNASFFIRGITSFGADSKKDPLILIDGVELTTDDLARLNTDDIASFSIMKDATSTALYGARGANGVILVTTKEGKEGAVSVNIRLENSFSSPTRKVQITDPVTYMRMHNEAIKTRDPMGLALYTPEKILMTERGLYPDIYPATDWYKATFNDVTINQRANISVSGGGAIARYYVAANISNDNGNMKIDKRNNFNSNISLQKYTIRSNINVNLTKTSELILRVNASYDEYLGPIRGGSDMYKSVMQANPVMFKPYYVPDEQFSYAKHILFGNYGHSGYINPYAESLKGYRDYSKNLMLTQFEFKQKLDMLTEGLKARIMVNMDRYSEYTVDRQYFPFYYNISSFDLLTNTYKLQRLNPDGGDETINYMPRGRYVNSTFYMEAVAEYNRVFSEKHTVNGMLVYIVRQKKSGISEDLQRSLPNRNLGLSGRLAYNYDSRYFAEFNFGYNGSERFSEKKRWGFFPSVGAAWMLSNEKFFSSLKEIVPVLKLKGTYGLVGNDAIGSDSDRFYYLSDVDLYASRAVNWGTQLGYNPLGIDIRRYANDQIGWEVSYKTNLGLELELKYGLSANIEVFKERRENILLTRIIPATMGIIPEVKANLGVGSGRGFDAELNYEKSFNKDLWLTGRATFTYATSEVIEWEEPDYSATPWKSRVGQSIQQQWGLVAERLFIDDIEVQNSPAQFGNYMAGDIKYRDVNGDGKISALDEVPIGHPTTPEINYGFGLSAGYKGLDVSFFFQGSARQSFWFDLNGVTPFMDSDGDDGRLGQNAIMQVFADSYWSENNRNPYALWPRLANSFIDNNTRRNTWFMQDASFIRLKTVEIGYKLPETWTNRVYLKNCRIYVSGTNLFSISGFKLWDPEMAGNGLGYPLQRVFNIGLNIGF